MKGTYGYSAGCPKMVTLLVGTAIHSTNRPMEPEVFAGADISARGNSMMGH